MYDFVEKKKKKRSLFNKSIDKKKQKVWNGFTMVDNRLETSVQRRLQEKYINGPKGIKETNHCIRANGIEENKNRLFQKKSGLERVIQRYIIEDESFIEWNRLHENPLAEAKATERGQEIYHAENYSLLVKCQDQEDPESNRLATFQKQIPREPKRDGTVTLWLNGETEDRCYIAELLHEIDLHAYPDFQQRRYESISEQYRREDIPERPRPESIPEQHRRIYSDIGGDNYRQARYTVGRNLLLKNDWRLIKFLGALFMEFQSAYNIVEENANYINWMQKDSSDADQGPPTRPYNRNNQYEDIFDWGPGHKEMFYEYWLSFIQDFEKTLIECHVEPSQESYNDAESIPEDLFSEAMITLRFMRERLDENFGKSELKFRRLGTEIPFTFLNHKTNRNDD